MTYYHCSPTGGLRVLEPRTPEHFDKTGGVYLTTLRPMALLYGVRNFEYTYGYTKEQKLVYEEYYPDALRTLYAGKAASLYICEPAHVEATCILNEAVSQEPVAVLREERIDDLYAAILGEAQAGTMIIRRYEELSARMQVWIEEEETREIIGRGLLHTPGPMADYMRLHYPKSWEKAQEAMKR